MTNNIGIFFLIMKKLMPLGEPLFVWYKQNEVHLYDENFWM